MYRTSTKISKKTSKSICQYIGMCNFGFAKTNRIDEKGDKEYENRGCSKLFLAYTIII